MLQLSLNIDAQNKTLVSGLTNASPVTLDGFFREDSVDLVIKLFTPTNNLTAPFDLVDISNLTLQVAVGERDGTANALQGTWTKDTTAGVMTFSGNLVIHTTEINTLLSATTAESIEQWFEVEIQDSGKIHTVLQEKITITQDVIRNSQLSPSNVAAPSALATSMADILTDGVTVQWTKSGDDITGHIKGLSGLSDLTGDSGKILSVKSSEDGFELGSASNVAGMDDLSDAETSSASGGDHLAFDSSDSKWKPSTTGVGDLDDLSDTDLSTATPTDGDHLEFDSSDSKWKPSGTVISHSHTLDGLSDVTATSPTDGQIIKYDDASSTFILSSAGADQNLWATITSDSGSITADSATDTLTIEGGEGIDTSIAGDTLTVAAEQASDTNKGIATFNATNFDVDGSGDVTLKNVPITDGGTGKSSKEDAFDALSPLTAQGDLVSYDGSDNIRLGKGTAGQVLKVNSGATDIEWADESGGGGGDTFKTVSVIGQDDVVADASDDGLTLVAGSNVTLTTDASADSVTIAASSGGGMTVTTVSSGSSYTVTEDGNDQMIYLVHPTLATDFTLNIPAAKDVPAGRKIIFAPLDAQYMTNGGYITITAASGLISTNTDVLNDNTPTDSIYYFGGAASGEGIMSIDLISDGGHLDHPVSNDGLWMSYHFDDSDYWQNV